MSKNTGATGRNTVKSEVKPKVKLDVKFDKPGEVYKCGETVSGIVIIKNDDAIEITGLTVTLRMKRENKTLNEWSGTNDFQTVNLYSELVGNSKDRSKVLPAGPNNIRFTFSPIPIHYMDSQEKDSETRSYFIRTEMKTKNEDSIKNTKKFKVHSLLLNEYDEPQMWKTKTEKKAIPLSLKKSKITVTVPTGFDGGERALPIHLVISNRSKYPKTIIRSRLLRTMRCPAKSQIKEQVSIRNESVEEINISEGETIHFLKVANGFPITFSCPLISQTYKIEVEVETSNCTMKVDFPLICGRWKNGVATREKAPYEVKNDTGLKQETEAPKTQSSKPPMPQTPPAPAGPLPSKHHPVPSSSNPAVPTAPPMEEPGAARLPTYEEATQEW